MTSLPSIMVMLMHPRTQNCVVYVRPDHNLMRRSCYSCLPWGFRSCAMWCCIAGLEFPAVSKERWFTLVSKYVFPSWIHLFLHFVAGCIKPFPSDRCAKSDSYSEWQWYTRISKNKKGNERITWHWAAFTKPLLLWKSNKY